MRSGHPVRQDLGTPPAGGEDTGSNLCCCRRKRFQQVAVDAERRPPAIPAAMPPVGRRSLWRNAIGYAQRSTRLALNADGNARNVQILSRRCDGLTARYSRPAGVTNDMTVGD